MMSGFRANACDFWGRKIQMFPFWLSKLLKGMLQMMNVIAESTECTAVTELSYSSL